MSRELKFRVWDGVDYMTMPFTLSDLQGGHPGFTFDCAVMQFTGLKDKNGKEIYEGDVVEAKSWQPMNYAVEFIEGGFCFTHPKLKGSPIDINLMYSSNGCACSVIGNIYENPELLKP